MASPIPHSAGGGQGGADVLYVRLVSRILEGVPEGDALGVGRLLCCEVVPRPLVHPFLGCSGVGFCPEGVVFHVVGAAALGARLVPGSFVTSDGSTSFNLVTTVCASVPSALNLRRT